MRANVKIQIYSVFVFFRRQKAKERTVVQRRKTLKRTLTLRGKV